jgi:hypothetical protein
MQCMSLPCVSVCLMCAVVLVPACSSLVRFDACISLFRIDVSTLLTLVRASGGENRFSKRTCSACVFSLRYQLSLDSCICLTTPNHATFTGQDVIANLNIPTSVPLLYQLEEKADGSLVPVKQEQAYAPMSGCYLGDQV